MTKEMFDAILDSAKEYTKRLELFWEKRNKYRKTKVRNAADILTAQYIIYGGSEYGSTFKATSLACTMQEADFDYEKTMQLLANQPKF